MKASIPVCRSLVFKQSLQYVGAGGPFPLDDEHMEDVSIDALLIKNPHATFLMKIDGDTLAAEEGIYSGDIVVIDRSRESHANDLVLAIVDGEFSICRRSTLVAQPQPYTAVWGIIVAAIRIFRM